MTDLSAIAAEFINDSDAAPVSVIHTAPLWRWQAKREGSATAWFFVTIAGEAGEALAGFIGVRGGFASIKVEARVGKTVWRTSVFPSKDPPGFLLPVKASVRKAEGIAEGDEVEVELTLV